jgi:hypothetical protein
LIEQNFINIGYVAAAAAFRARVAAAESAWWEKTEALLQPFRQQPDGRPPRRARKHLERLARDWRRLGGFGRLRCRASVEGGSLQILETRLTIGEVARAGWSGSEASVALALRTVAIEAPRRFAEAITFMVSLGEHAVGRYYERRAADDDALVADLSHVLAAYPELAQRGGRFVVPVGDGSWQGEVIERPGGGERLLRVQTFVPQDGRSGFRFDEVARLRESRSSV